MKEQKKKIKEVRMKDSIKAVSFLRKHADRTRKKRQSCMTQMPFGLSRDDLYWGFERAAMALEDAAKEIEKREK